MNHFIDIGVNLGNSRFDSDRQQVLERATDAGVRCMILTGTTADESRQVAELCLQFPGNGCDLYATAGVHPHYASDFSSETAAELREIAALSQVVAIGETGLDFNRNFSPRNAQEKAFSAQLELAAELQLPVFMHERDAAEREADIIGHYRDHLSDAVIHCFTGDKKALFRYLDLDLYIGITGWVCDERRGQDLQQLVKNIPLNRLLIESDAPFLLPRNMPSPPPGKRNEPAFLPWVAEGIAAHRSEAIEEIISATTDNARRFFRLTEES